MAMPLHSSAALLHAALVLLFLYQLTACSARNWRMLREETPEIAEVVHMSSSLVQYRRHLQTGTYCVAKTDADATQLQAALDWACGSGQGQGNVNCSPLQLGGSCYLPNTIQAHASYAFNAYYVSQNAASGSCGFNNLATTTTSSPSSTSTCVYQPYTGSNSNTNSNSSSSLSGTPPPPFTTTSPSSNNSGTIFSPTGDNTTTTGVTNFAPSSFNVIPWLCSLYAGLLIVTVL